MVGKIGIFMTMIGMAMADSTSLVVPILVTGTGLLLTTIGMRREA